MSLCNLKRVVRFLAMSRHGHWKYCRGQIRRGKRPFGPVPNDGPALVSRALAEALTPKIGRLSMGFRGEAEIVVRRWELSGETKTHSGVAAHGFMEVEFDVRTEYQKVRSLVPIMHDGGLVGEATWCGELKTGFLHNSCTIKFRTSSPDFARKALSQVCLP